MSFCIAKQKIKCYNKEERNGQLTPKNDIIFKKIFGTDVEEGREQKQIEIIKEMLKLRIDKQTICKITKVEVN